MTEERLLRLLPHLPDGVSEIYLHPAAAPAPAFLKAMPGYRHQDEFAALLSPALGNLIRELGIRLGNYTDFATVLSKN